MVNQLAEAIKSIFTRVGEFFDIFDLSFFVSGAVCLAALGYWNHLDRFYDPSSLGEYRAVGAALACYVLGLFCFAAGRGLRRRSRPRFLASIKALVDGHRLSRPTDARYVKDVDDIAGADRLYTRLWVDLRQTPSLAPSFALLKRYWVMAATYDGLTAAFIVWFLVVARGWLLRSGAMPLHASIAVAVLLAIAIYACRREAGRLMHYQREELVAAMAWLGDEEAHQAALLVAKAAAAAAAAAPPATTATTATTAAAPATAAAAPATVATTTATTAAAAAAGGDEPEDNE